MSPNGAAIISSANAPGLPSADDSISTTRITLPDNLPPDTGRVDTQRIVPEHPHWPLVFMLVLTQLSAGAFAALWILDLLRGGAGSTLYRRSASLALAGISLGAATLHLGRPIYAWRALKGLRRSWLSREVLTLSIFAGVGGAYAGMLLLHLPGRPAAGLADRALRMHWIVVFGADLYGPSAAGMEQPLYASPSSSPPPCCWVRCSCGHSTRKRCIGSEGMWLARAAVAGGAAAALDAKPQILVAFAVGGIRIARVRPVAFGPAETRLPDSPGIAGRRRSRASPRSRLDSGPQR